MFIFVIKLELSSFVLKRPQNPPIFEYLVWLICDSEAKLLYQQLNHLQEHGFENWVIKDLVYQALAL